MITTKFHRSLLLLVIYNLILQFSFALIHPGRTNAYYPIESYYGSRDKEYFTRDAILNDQPTTFQWSTNFDYDEENGLLYFASRSEHTIQYRNLTSNDITIVAGIEDNSGFRDGSLDNTLFSAPSALKIFRYNSTKAQLERSKVVIILKDDSVKCEYANYLNYTDCEDSSTDDALIDPSKIKEIFFPFNASDVTDEDLELEKLSGKIIYVTDTGNNCIRKLDLIQQVSTTFAGECGTEGFKDGPLGVNLFNSPGSLGVDDAGNVFVRDSHNVYMRIINGTGFVQTLIQGACREAYNQAPIMVLKMMKVRLVTCYRNWIKTSGLPSEHIFTDLTTLQKCFSNDVLCGGKNRSHPVLYQNSTFRGSNLSTDRRRRRLNVDL
jgi:hypothetical protein